MPSTLENIRNIIDEQNVENLQRFIEVNQNINYDNITPNGASALWWALMPPAGKKANKAIIGCLLNARKEDGSHLVNPVQTLFGLTPSRYLLSNYPTRDPLGVRRLIQDAENLYEVPQRAAAHGRTLAAIAMHEQSVHDSTVGPLSRGNVIRLHQYYVEETSNPLGERKAAKEIEALINSLQKEQGENAEQMLYGLRFCYSNASHFEFQSSEENHESFRLTLAQLIALNWIAAKEQDAGLLPNGATDKEALESRKKAILNILYDIATAYGKNGASCSGGACNRLGMALASQHKLVQAYPVGERITNEVASLVFLRILGQTIEQLSKDNKVAYWAVIRYLTLPDNDAQEIKSYEAFINANKESLLAQMLDENIDEKWAADAIAVLEEGDYPLANHIISYQLFHLMSIMNQHKFDLTLFDGNTSIEKAVDEAVNMLAEKLLKSSESFLFLKEKFGINREYADLTLEKNFILQWLALARRRQGSDDLHSFIKVFKSSEFSEDCFVLSFFLTEKEELKQKNPAQAKWLEHLSNEQIISLMSAVNEASPLRVSGPDDLMQQLILKAMESGVTANLSFEGMHFVGKDFRAFDFSGATLSNVTFENCLLPLAGSNIHCNNVSMINCHMPSVDENAGIEKSRWFAELFGYLCKNRNYISSSLVTQFYLSQSSKEELKLSYDSEGSTALMNAAGIGGHIEIVKEILASDKCSRELLEHTETDKTALTLAIIYGHTAVVKEILASDKCSRELLEHADIDGRTSLIEAAYRKNIAIVKEILANAKCSRELLERADNMGYTALMMAGLMSAAIVKEILASDKCSPKHLDRVNHSGDTALICAADIGNTAAVKEFLASDKCSLKYLERANRMGYTALTLAIANGHTAVAKEILLSDKCTREFLERANSEGYTALIMAVRHGSTASVKEILANAKCSRKLLEHADRDGQTALIEAASRGEIAITKEILANAKCSRKLLEHTDRYGRTALIGAASCGNIAIVKEILASNKCSLKLLKQANRDGHLPHILASRAGRSEMAKEIRTCIAYQTIWESKGSESDKILAVLDDYCKGTRSLISQLSVFAHGHFNRHHTAKLRNLLKDHALGDKSVSEILDELKQLPKNETGSLARRLKFIESRSHLNQSQEAHQENSRPPGPL